jgi:hypothetical protein
MSDTFAPKLASATSAAPAGSSTAASLAGDCPQVRLAWKATSGGVANIRWGKGAQTAVTSDLTMFDGTVETFTKQDATDLAVIGTGTLYIICGHGN